MARNPRPKSRPTRAGARAWQRMLSGRRLDLLDPSPLDVEIADVAHGLARAAAYLEATRLAGFSAAEAGRFFGRAPEFSAVIERDYLTPWPAEVAEVRYLNRVERLARE